MPETKVKDANIKSNKKKDEKIEPATLPKIEQWDVDFALPASIDGVEGKVSFNFGESITPTFEIDLHGKLVLPTELLVEDISTVGEESKIINVERDYKGNLKKAIAVAKDGDVVSLGNKTYVTDGLVVDKDILIIGQKNTVIDGKGTLDPIIQLTAEASGATIRDLAITNGNNGIVSEGTENLTLSNLEIYDIGLKKVIRNGTNNTGIDLYNSSGFRILDSRIYDIGKKAVGIADTDQGVIHGLEVRNVNIAGEHAQSHDAAGIKLFNTNEILVEQNYFSDINAIYLWNDITNKTSIIGNVMLDVGSDFLAPAFNDNVETIGIYNEKSPNSIVKDNKASSVKGTTAFRATEFTTETMTLEGNDFSSFQLGTTDYWANEKAEKLVALTEDPLEAGFSLYAEDYLAEANIGE